MKGEPVPYGPRGWIRLASILGYYLELALSNVGKVELDGNRVIG